MLPDISFPQPKGSAMTAAKNRYADAPRNADYTIDQMWHSYSGEEHDRWDRL
jgi:phenylalanine-4-hydroxylase